MSATPITTHVADATARLSWQFQDKVQFVAFLGAFVARLQTIESVCHALANGRYVDDAVGILLDRIGEQVGQDRDGGRYPNGEIDSLYRVKVKARILVNKSRGTQEDLRGIVAAICGATLARVHQTDSYPAGFVLAVGLTGALPAGADTALISMVLAGKSAGVQLVGLLTYTDPVFGFAEDPDPYVGTLDDGTSLPGAGTFAAVLYF